MSRLDKKIKLILTTLKKGKMIIIIDDKNRENEGDIAAAGEKVSSKIINFMIKEGRGLVCVAMTGERLKELKLPQMVECNEDKKKTRFSVTVDHVDCKTGISAYERAKTIKALADEKTLSSELRRPGHIFPLESNGKGIFERAGHTEAILELLNLAGMKSIGVICEIIRNDGRMARKKDLSIFSMKFGLPIININEIKKYLIEVKSNEKI